MREVGLTQNESLIYLALLELGPSLAGQISQETGLHRRTVYDVIEMLIKKGLVGYISKNNRKLFEAASPNKFLDIIKERESTIQDALPGMLALYGKTQEKQETNFYTGKEGLRTVFEDQISEGKEILILGASESAFEILPFYFKWYDKDRVKKKIKVRIIASDKLGKKIPMSAIRYLPKKYANPLAINIYRDKVAIVLWKKNPLAIVIKNSEISESYKKYFELMWKISKKG